MGIAAFFLTLFYMNGREAIHDWQASRAIKTDINAGVKNSEIRNHRADDDLLFKRMFAGKF